MTKSTHEVNKLDIGIYSPYFHIFGGGERYLLSIAEYLNKRHNVFIFTDVSLTEKAKSVFNIHLDRVQFLPEEKFRTKKLFDILFYMTDGSLFLSLSKKNFLIIQSPSHIPSNTLINKIKLFNWKVVCYSEFMQKIINEKLKVSSIILPPAIDIGQFKSDSQKKENIILTVGRFFSHLHNKRHDSLIEVFKKYYKTVFKDWKLVIAGGVTDQDGERVVDDLKKQSQGYSIEVLTDISFDRLRSLYKKAKIYWHAAGFGEDLDKYPEKAEHFGITTLEAMAAGCVPLVFEAGGQMDIVTEGRNGYLWSQEGELVNKSKAVMNDSQLLATLSVSAQKRAQDFSLESFYEKINQLISE